MIGLPAGTRIWLVAGTTDMRRGRTGSPGAYAQNHDGSVKGGVN